MWKNVVGPDLSETPVQKGACALHAAYLRLQTKLRI